MSEDTLVDMNSWCFTQIENYWHNSDLLLFNEYTIIFLSNPVHPLTITVSVDEIAIPVTF